MTHMTALSKRACASEQNKCGLYWMCQWMESNNVTWKCSIWTLHS